MVTFHDIPQKAGNIAHSTIDQATYSSAKRYLQSLCVFCEKYGLVGKIDVFDQKEQKLIERKNKIKVLHTGYKYQLWAQYFCLSEMGHKVKSLWLHSLQDNKRYAVELPNESEIKEFEAILYKIRHYDVVAESSHWQDDPSRDPFTIYNKLYF